MLRGLYTAASSLTANMLRNEVSANNLANVNTFGYKKKETASKSFEDELIHRIDYTKAEAPKNPIGRLGNGVVIDNIFTNYRQGGLVSTDKPLDIALKGDGYFVVQDSQGSEFYTRNGSFALNSDGQLTNQSGQLVMGENGPININSININVSETGEIFSDNQLVTTLRIETIENPREIGDGLFIGENATEDNNTQVHQGFVEMSNVNSVDEMVQMINVMRSYESNQKVVQSYDNTLDKLINEVGRV